MSSSLKWSQPRAVAEWEWANQSLPAFREVAWFHTRWVLLLGGPTLCGVAFWAPDHLNRIAGGMALLAASPLVALLQGKLWSWFGARYALDAQGLRRHGRAPALYRWKEIEAWRFADHLDFPELRRLEFKVRRFEDLCTWSFDPASVDEPTLRAILDAHLPTPVG